MNSFQCFVRNNFPTNKTKFKPARYPLLEWTHHLTIALLVIGISCNILPGGIPSITPKPLHNDLKSMGEKEDNDKKICISLV